MDAFMINLAQRLGDRLQRRGWPPPAIIVQALLALVASILVMTLVAFLEGHRFLALTGAICFAYMAFTGPRLVSDIQRNVMEWGGPLRDHYARAARDERGKGGRERLFTVGLAVFVNAIAVLHLVYGTGLLVAAIGLNTLAIVAVAYSRCIAPLGDEGEGLPTAGADS